MERILDKNHLSFFYPILLEPNMKFFLWKLVHGLNNMFTLYFLYCILYDYEINIILLYCCRNSLINNVKFAFKKSEWLLASYFKYRIEYRIYLIFVFGQVPRNKYIRYFYFVSCLEYISVFIFWGPTFGSKKMGYLISF